MKYNDTTFRIVRAWLSGARINYTAREIDGTILLRTAHTVITCGTVAYIKVTTDAPGIASRWGKTQWDIVRILEAWRDRGVKL